MPSLPVQLRQVPTAPRAPSALRQGFSPEPPQAGGTHRDRIWELSPTLHCSVIGTCLTAGELRRLFAKLDDADARSASDHVLHGRAVSAAGKQGLAGKLLNKMLDKRHETQVKRFAKAKNAEAVRDLWRVALDRGDIPGAYWAVLTHPATDHALVQEVFGEVHMLSHLVGTSNRADITRLRQLEHDLEDRDDKILRQEALLQRKAQERGELIRRLDDLYAELTRRKALQPSAVHEPVESVLSAVKCRLTDEQARSARLADRVAELERSLDAKADKIDGLEDHVAILAKELASLEAVLTDVASPSRGVSASRGVTEAPAELGGTRILYVGGRPKQLEQLRAVTANFGGILLRHDGGIEDNTALLPGLVSQADVAMFPVDCVSHLAAGQVKRLCRAAGKSFLPLRSASLASFVTAIGSLNRTMASPRCDCASPAPDCSR